jgi:hypothetical protein
VRIRSLALLLAAFLTAALLWWYGRYQTYRGRRDMAELAGGLASQGAELAMDGRFGEAVLRFRQARSLAPEDSCIADGLSSVYGNWLATLYQGGEHRKVLLVGAGARRQGVRNPVVHYCNAMSFYRDGQPDSAYALLREASTTMAPDQAVSGALAKLESERGVLEEFESGRSGYFEIRFEGGENREVSSLVLQLMEDIRDRVGGELGHRMQRTTVVVLYSDRQFRDITRLAGWAGAAFDGQIKVPIAGYREDRELLERVLVHEFTHAALYDLAGGRVPAWLNEGLAMLFEGVEREPGGYMPLFLMDKPFTAMGESQALKAYRASYSAVKYLTTQYDMAFVRMLSGRLKEGKTFEASFIEVYGMTVKEFEQKWKQSLE